MDYGIYLVTLTMIFISLAIGLRILVGMCGIVSVCHAAFFGIGAYGAVLSERLLGIPPLMAPLLLTPMSALFGYVVARGALRIRDDYLVIFTLAVQLIFTNLVRNGGEITGGPAGLTSVGSLVDLASTWSSVATLLGVCATMFATAGLSILIGRSPFGVALAAMRDDEVFARSVGKDVSSLKTAAFALSAGTAAAIGAMYPRFTGFIDPSQFTINQSIAVLSMVIIGGTGRIAGSVMGAALLVLIPEVLRGVGFTGAVGNLRQIALGALLTVIVIYRPGGLLGGDVLAKPR